MQPPPVPADAVPADINELYDRFCRPAFSLARRILGDETLAEDVVQDVFLGVWRNPAAFDASRGSLASWLMTVVHHRAVDAVRREQSQRDRWARMQDAVTGMPLSVGADVENAACERADAGRVRVALSALPAPQRQALALAYYSGFTQSEIAVLTETPLGTVKTRMRAGIGQLRLALADVATVPSGRGLFEAV